MNPTPVSILVSWGYHTFDDVFRRDGLALARSLRGKTRPDPLFGLAFWRHIRALSLDLLIAVGGAYLLARFYLQYHPLSEGLWIGTLSLEVFVVALSSLTPLATTALTAISRAMLDLYSQYGYTIDVAEALNADTTLRDLRWNGRFYNALFLTVSIAVILMVLKPFLTPTGAWVGMLLSLVMFYQAVRLLYGPLFMFQRLSFLFQALTWIAEKHASLPMPCPRCASRSEDLWALQSMLIQLLAIRRGVGAESSLDT